MSPSASPAPPEREPRGARRKRETRSKLLAAAARLFAERGLDAVAVNEITEAADVGFGSFYNHFESKGELYDSLINDLFEEFAGRLDALLAGVRDPAEIIAASVRLTISRALREPLWGGLLVREGLSTRSVESALGRRLLRDIKSGIAKRRFGNGDPLLLFAAINGIVISSIACGEITGKTMRAKIVPEYCASIVLQALGIPRREAERIASRPLRSAIALDKQ